MHHDTVKPLILAVRAMKLFWHQSVNDSCVVSDLIWWLLTLLPKVCWMSTVVAVGRLCRLFHVALIRCFRQHAGFVQINLAYCLPVVERRCSQYLMPCSAVVRRSWIIEPLVVFVLFRGWIYVLRTYLVVKKWTVDKRVIYMWCAIWLYAKCHWSQKY